MLRKVLTALVALATLTGWESMMLPASANGLGVRSSSTPPQLSPGGTAIPESELLQQFLREQLQQQPEAAPPVRCPAPFTPSQKDHLAIYSQDLVKVFHTASEIAQKQRHYEVSVVHLLAALLKEMDASTQILLNNSGPNVDSVKMKEILQTQIESRKNSDTLRQTSGVGREVVAVLARARELRTELNAPLVDEKLVLLALLENPAAPPFPKDMVPTQPFSEVKAGIAQAIANEKQAQADAYAANELERQRKEYAKNPDLSMFILDLSHEVKNLKDDAQLIDFNYDPAHAKRIFLQTERNALAFVGDSRTGKTTFGYFLAKSLPALEVFRVDINAMLKFVSSRSASEAKAMVGRIKRNLQESSDSDLFIVDGLDQLAAPQAGASRKIFSQLLLDLILEAKDVKFAFTVNKRGHRLLKSHPRWAARVVEVALPGFTDAQLTALFEARIALLSSHHGVRFPGNIIQLALGMKQEINGSIQPAIGLDLIDRIASFPASRLQELSTDSPDRESASNATETDVDLAKKELMSELSR